MKEEEMKQEDLENPGVATDAVAQETPPGKKELLRERLTSKYPDGVYDDDEALYAGVLEEWDREDAEVADTRNKMQELSNLFRQSPEVASFFIDMMNGMGLYEALGRNFGANLIEMLGSNGAEAREYDKGMREWQADADARAERERVYGENVAAFQTEFDAWLEDQGYSDEEREALTEEAVRIGNAMSEGKFMDFMRSLDRSKRYDADIEAARAEGEIRGRNARIAEERTLPRSKGDGLPAMRGMSRPEGEVTPRKKNNGWEW